jgi:dihydrofolate reductase
VTVRLIWAQSTNGVIGNANELPWHIPEDMARFRELTTGGVVVMGRRTWESLPERFRPLPGRDNVVVSRDPAYVAEGARVLPSVDAGVASAPEVWVIGGGEVYAAAMAVADRLYITDVDLEVEGDVRAPSLDAGWRQVEAGEWRVSRGGPRFRWRVLARS